MAQKADSARPHLLFFFPCTIKTASIKKVGSPVGLRQQQEQQKSTCRTNKALMQASFVPQLNCYSFKFHTEIKSGKNKEKEATMDNFRNTEKSTV